MIQKVPTFWPVYSSLHQGRLVSLEGDSWVTICFKWNITHWIAECEHLVSGLPSPVLSQMTGCCYKLDTSCYNRTAVMWHIAGPIILESCMSLNLGLYVLPLRNILHSLVQEAIYRRVPSRAKSPYEKEQPIMYCVCYQVVEEYVTIFGRRLCPCIIRRP